VYVLAIRSEKPSYQQIMLVVEPRVMLLVSFKLLDVIDRRC